MMVKNGTQFVLAEIVLYSVAFFVGTMDSFNNSTYQFWNCPVKRETECNS